VLRICILFAISGRLPVSACLAVLAGNRHFAISGSAIGGSAIG
jgi:hypothetical protein